MGEEDVSRETDQGQAEMDEIRDQLAEDREAAQAELDEAWAKRRTKETEALTRREARNYQETHAVIEPNEDMPEGASPAINEE